MSSPGEFIARNRRAAGLSQRELAQKAFMHQSSVSRVECDKLSPSVRMVEHLLAAMNRKLILCAGDVEDA